MKTIYLLTTLLILTACNYNIEFSPVKADRCKGVENKSAEYWLLQCEEDTE